MSSFSLIDLDPLKHIPIDRNKENIISGLYFPVFSPNTRKYGPEITQYLDIFDTVCTYLKRVKDVMEVCWKSYIRSI